MTEEGVGAGRRGRWQRWVVIGLFWVAEMVVTYAIFSLGILLPSIGQDLNMGPVEAGWLGASAFLGPTLLALALSILVPHLNQRWLVALSLAACGVLFLLQGWAPDYPALLGGRALFVAISVALMLAGVMLTQQWFEPREIVLVNSIFAGLMGLTQAVTAAATPPSISILGWRGIYYGVGLLFLAIFVIWVGLGAERTTPEYRSRMRAQQGTPLRALGRHPLLWLVASCQIGGALGYASFMTFWPSYAYLEQGFPLSVVGLLFSIFPIGSVVGSFSAGVISDRLGRRKPLVWLAGFALPFAYWGLITAPWVPLLVGCLFLAGFFAFVVVPVIRTFPFEMPELSPQEVAVGLALIATLTPLGATMGPVLAGFLYSAFGSLKTALTVTSAFPFAMGGLGLLLPETGWKARPHPASGSGPSG